MFNILLTYVCCLVKIKLSKYELLIYVSRKYSGDQEVAIIKGVKIFIHQ